MKLIKSPDHSRYLTAEWGKESLDISVNYRGPSSGYSGAQLDGEIIPHIVACVNAMEDATDPSKVCILSRCNAEFISDLLTTLADMAAGDDGLSDKLMRGISESQKRLAR